MINKVFTRAAVIVVWLLALLVLDGCDKLNFNKPATNALGNRPDLDCLIANDFYAVHFSSYVQPSKDQIAEDAKAAFVPFCQKIPRAGKMFFTADLIDRDIRTIPIGIKIVEVEKTGQKAPDDFREIRTVAEIPSKLYPRGAVEAQAEIDKNGDYRLYLLIGDAVEEDDRFKIALEVGVDPNALSIQEIASIAGGVLLLMILIAVVVVLIRRQSRKV
ncbi:MAG: hypothetical protein EBR59_03010 [Methylococcaceae bacterium]|nr:hypothetical protein [Methylococcaceae bacterium]